MRVPAARCRADQKLTVGSAAPAGPSAPPPAGVMASNAPRMTQARLCVRSPHRRRMRTVAQIDSGTKLLTDAPSASRRSASLTSDGISIGPTHSPGAGMSPATPAPDEPDRVPARPVSRNVWLPTTETLPTVRAIGHPSERTRPRRGQPADVSRIWPTGAGVVAGSGDSTRGVTPFSVGPVSDTSTVLRAPTAEAAAGFPCDLVRAHATANGDRTALVDLNGSAAPVSYAGLMERVDTLAARLRDHGVGPEQP